MEVWLRLVMYGCAPAFLALAALLLREGALRRQNLAWTLPALALHLLPTLAVMFMFGSEQYRAEGLPSAGDLFHLWAYVWIWPNLHAAFFGPIFLALYYLIGYLLVARWIFKARVSRFQQLMAVFVDWGLTIAPGVWGGQVFMEPEAGDLPFYWFASAPALSVLFMTSVYFLRRTWSALTHRPGRAEPKEGT